MRFCPLCSGSSGNATYIEAGSARLLIDAGLSCKRITELLSRIGVTPDTLSAILITHEHVDHVRGVNVLSKKYDLPVYANADTWSMLHEPLSGVAPKNVCVFESDRDFYLAGARVYPLSCQRLHRPGKAPDGRRSHRQGRRPQLLLPHGIQRRRQEHDRPV